MDSTYLHAVGGVGVRIMTGNIYMKRAMELAEQAAAEGEVPVGAVIVRISDGLVIGEGRNRREKKRSPLAHAEIEAINAASSYLGGWRLSGCEMYVTLEPCPMCAGAVINSRLDRVIFGAYDDKSGSCGSVVNLFDMGYNHRPQVIGGVMESECAGQLKIFFREMRKRKMDSIKLVKAETDDQLRRIAEIADGIWHEFFPCLLSGEQIDYMVEKFCSFEASKENVLKENYSYYFIKRSGTDIGYTAAKPDGDRLFLSKLYLKKEERGKKYARRVMEMYREIARENGFKAIHLTVNKYNENSIAAYKAMGFVITGEGVTDIGKGFVMDDFYMEMKI